MEEDSSMAGLVSQGFGIAVMPDIPILRSLSVKTLDIYNPPYERAVYLATLKQRYLSPVAKAFYQVCDRGDCLAAAFPHKLYEALDSRKLVFACHVAHVYSV